ncbi:hypothetical protein [Oleiagrimonas sp.]|jgi:hypothetical protein|uniref:ArnT family glycosyltransferase n=1 Tax=Oleiagrimonas sp. TaxID=2010330 RepID=UPI0026029078|nr:hypothetical protein [Oleiagrimonas sp.]MDA3913408.1 hypothetical protein [Oleiagrimonas sp.]
MSERKGIIGDIFGQIRHARKVAIAFMALWVILIAGHLLIVVFHTPPSFDGAMNLQVARSLSEGNGYRRLYAQQDLFPHEIQTKAPYILPAAAIFHVFGIGIAQSEAVNVVYFIALLVLAWILMRTVIPRELCFLGPLAVLATPGLTRYGFFGYGEIPSLVWFLAATIIYFQPESPRMNKQARAVLAGILLALSYLTKTVMLIGMGAFGAAALIELFLQRHKAVRNGWTNILLLGVSAAIPTLAFETWKVIALGYRPWLNWWHTEFWHILWQAGLSHSHAHHAESIVHKVLNHLHTMAGFYGLPRWIAGIWVALILGVGLAALLRSLREPRFLIATTILGAACIYMIWWLGATPDSRAWLRRIMDGMLLANLGVLLFVLTTLSGSARQLIAKSVFSAALLALPAWSLIQQSIGIKREKNPDNTSLMDVAYRVKALPQDAYLFGIGWWSAPNVALFSGRNILNFNQVAVVRLDKSRPAYIVAEPIVPQIRKFNHAFIVYGLKIPQSHSYGLYRIPDFTPKPIKPGKTPVRSYIKYSDNYPYMEGSYKPVIGFGMWLASDNTILLNHGKSKTFVIKGYAEAQKQYLYPGEPKVTVSFDGCKAPPLLVPTDKVFTLHVEVPRNCKHLPNDPWLVRIQVDNVIDILKAGGDFRALSILAKGIGFVSTK